MIELGAMLIGTASELLAVLDEGTLGEHIVTSEDIGDAAATGLGLEEQLKGLSAGERAPDDTRARRQETYSLGKMSSSMQTSMLETRTPICASTALATAERTSAASLVNG